MIEETEEARAIREARTPPTVPAAGVGGDGFPALAPPVRRIVVDSPPTVAAPTVVDHGLARTARAPSGPERMTLDALSVFYGPKAAVKDVSIGIRQGEVLALIGPSGCGKTTLLRTLNRLTELTATARRDGTIALDGRDIDTLEVTELRRRVAMVFQQPNPFPMSIFDNVAYALREQAMKRPGKSVLQPLVVDALKRAGLYDEVHDDLDRVDPAGIDVLALEQDLAVHPRARHQLVHPVERAQERRLAAAGRPDEGGHRPRLDGEGHALDRLEVAVVDVEVLDVDALGHGDRFRKRGGVQARTLP